MIYTGLKCLSWSYKATLILIFKGSHPQTSLISTNFKHLVHFKLKLWYCSSTPDTNIGWKDHGITDAPGLVDAGCMHCISTYINTTQCLNVSLGPDLRSLQSAFLESVCVSVVKYTLICWFWLLLSWWLMVQTGGMLWLRSRSFILAVLS